MRHRTGDKRPPAVDVAVGDHVLCRGGGSAQEGCCVSVGKILGLRKDSAGELYMLCRWYSRPEQAASGRRPYDGCNELLASPHVDLAPAECVLCHCRVLSAAAYTLEVKRQMQLIHAAREEAFYARPEPAEPHWNAGNEYAGDDAQVMRVLQRLLDRVEAEVRPDECRRLDAPEFRSEGSLAHWDVEEFPPPAGSALARSRALGGAGNTLPPKVGTGGNIEMLRHIFYSEQALPRRSETHSLGKIACPRILEQNGSYGLALDDDGLKQDEGFAYPNALLCPRASANAWLQKLGCAPFAHARMTDMGALTVPQARSWTRPPCAPRARRCATSSAAGAAWTTASRRRNGWSKCARAP